MRQVRRGGPDHDDQPGAVAPSRRRLSHESLAATSTCRIHATAGEPGWNFNKYLVGKDGKVIRRFDSDVEPDSKELSDAIDAALAK